MRDRIQTKKIFTRVPIQQFCVLLRTVFYISLCSTMMKNYWTFLYIELFRARYLSKTSFLLLKTCQEPIIRNAHLSYCAYVPRRSFAEQAIFRLLPVRLIGSFQPLVCCVCQDLTGQVMKQQTKDRKPKERKKKPLRFPRGANQYQFYPPKT